MEERDAGEEPAWSRPKCYVVVHNVAKRHNIGTLARSATAFGVTEIILVGKKDYNAFGSHGATVHIGFRHFHTLSAAVVFLKEEECDICGVEIADGALAVQSHPFKRNTAFVVGNEGSGLSAKEMEVCDFLSTSHSMVPARHLSTSLLRHQSCYIISQFGRGFMNANEKARNS